MKWFVNSSGWLLLGSMVLAGMGGFGLHKYKGYGLVEIRPIWLEKPYDVPIAAASSAVLRVQGKPSVFTPGKAIQLRPGPISIELKLEKFCLAATNVEVVKSLRNFADIRLVAEACRIEISNIPTNGSVNGEPASGKYLLEQAVVGKVYNFEVTAPGQETNALSVSIVTPGQDFVTNISWRPLLAEFCVNVDPKLPNTVISIDGGPTRPVSQMRLPAGQHTIQLQNQDYMSYQRMVEIQQGLTNRYDIQLEPLPALLSLSVLPEEGFELHDELGELVEVNNSKGHLIPGKHELTLSAPHHISQSKAFLMKANQEYKWVVHLQKEGDEHYRELRTRYETMTNETDSVLLERFGGLGWQRLRERTFNSDDLKVGAQQYEAAIKEFSALVEKCKVLQEKQATVEKAEAKRNAEELKEMNLVAEIEALLSPKSLAEAERREEIKMADDLIAQFEKTFCNSVEVRTTASAWRKAKLAEWRRINELKKNTFR